jgi:hypothetical protein
MDCVENEPQKTTRQGRDSSSCESGKINRQGIDYRGIVISSVQRQNCPIAQERGANAAIVIALPFI